MFDINYPVQACSIKNHLFEFYDVSNTDDRLCVARTEITNFLKQFATQDFLEVMSEFRGVGFGS